jgi:hypothetical protein
MRRIKKHYNSKYKYSKFNSMKFRFFNKIFVFFSVDAKKINIEAFKKVKMTPEEINLMHSKKIKLLLEAKSREIEGLPIQKISFYIPSDYAAEFIIEATIYIPEKEIRMEKIEPVVISMIDFCLALGFNIIKAEEPIFKSFFQKIKLAFSETIAKEDPKKIFETGKKALELKVLDLPTAEQTEKLSIAAKNLLDGMNNIEEGVARIGALMVLKVRIGGQTKVIISQLSQEVIILLDKQNPNLIYNLRTLYELVTGDVSKQ